MKKISALAGIILLEFVAAVIIAGETVLIPTLQSTFGIPDSSSGLILASYLIPFSVGLIPMGLLADKVGLKKSFFGSAFVFGLSSFMCAFAWSSNTFYLFRFIEGLGAAGVFACEFALIAKHYEDSYRTIEIVITGLSFGVIVGPVIGSAFVDYWKLFFILSAGIIFFGLLLSFPLVSLEPADNNSGLERAKENWKQGLKATIPLEFIVSITAVGLNVLLSIDSRTSAWDAALAMSTIAGGMLLNSVVGIGTRLAKKPKKALEFAPIVFAISVIGVGVIDTPLMVFSFILYGVIGVSLGVIYSSIELSVLNKTPEKKFAAVNSSILATMQGGHAVAAGMTPLIYTHFGFGLTVFLLGGVSLVMGGLFLLIS